MEDLETKAQELFEVYLKDIKDTSKPEEAARIIDTFYREEAQIHYMLLLED